MRGWLLLGLGLTLPGRAGAVPITLGQALDAAATGNLDLQVAATAVDVAEADRAAARADLLPSVSATAELGWGNSAVSPVPGADASAGVRAEVPLLDLPALGRDRAAAEGRTAARATYDAALDATLAEVARRYVALQQAREQVVAAEARRLRAERLRILANDRVELGAAPRIDLTRAQLAVRTEEARLLGARTAAAAAEVSLAEGLGLPVDTPIEVTEARPLLDPAALPSDADLPDTLTAALSSAPDLIAARARLAQATASRRAAAAAGAPSIAAYGAAGVVTDPLGETTSPVIQAGVTATIPIWAGGARAADVDAARAGEEADRLAVLVETRALESELRVALRVLRDAGTGIGVADDALALAREELERAESRYREGAEGNLVVVSAQAELAAAEQARVDAVAAYNRAVVGWYAAGGRMSQFPD